MRRWSGNRKAALPGGPAGRMRPGAEAPGTPREINHPSVHARSRHDGGEEEQRQRTIRYPTGRGDLTLNPCYSPAPGAAARGGTRISTCRLWDDGTSHTGGTCSGFEIAYVNNLGTQIRWVVTDRPRSPRLGAHGRAHRRPAQPAAPGTRRRPIRARRTALKFQQAITLSFRLEFAPVRRPPAEVSNRAPAATHRLTPESSAERYYNFRRTRSASCGAMSARSLRVPPAGIEPATPCLGGRCSIH